MFKNQLKRYAGLIISISLLIGFVIFVVIANSYLDSKVLQRDYFAATRTAVNAEVIQRLGPEDSNLRGEIYDHVKIIKDGGQLVSPYGPQWYKPGTTNQELLDAIAQIEASIDSKDNEQFKADYLNFSKVSAQAGFAALDNLTRLQWLAAAIIFLGFLGVLGFLFFKLGRADEKAEAIAAENSHIMATVTDGLFLINEEYDIGQQKSHAVREIYGEEADLSGNFFNFLKPFVAKEDLKLAEEYLELLFDGRVKQKLMTDLNPFQELAIEATQKTGAVTKKFISIGFARDENEKDSANILVSTKDITREIVLRDELEKTKDAQKEKMNLLMGVLHVNPDELNNFFKQADSGLNEINRILAEETGDHSDNLEKLENIYQISHRLKGDAGVLGLELFETSLHSFENAITELQGLHYVDGQSMLGLAVQLKDMISEVDVVRSIAPKVQNLRPTTGGNKYEIPDSSTASAADRLNMLAQRVAEREDKEVELDCTGFNLLDGDPELKEAIFDIAVQLVRNSIVHGIERPDERVQAGKKTFGTVSVLLSEIENGFLQLIVRDDGRGLQFARIKQKAIEEGLLSQTASLAIEPKNLLKFIFMQGFSSADHPSVDAGRGVGLDVVKAKVNDISGKIGVRTSRKKYCQFKILIPQEAA